MASKDNSVANAANVSAAPAISPLDREADRPLWEKSKTPEEQWKPGTKEWAVMLTFVISNVAVALDASILVTVLPTLAIKLIGTASEAFWTGTSYLLVSAVVQPFIAALSDIFGRRELLVPCLLFFTVASIICALANNFTVLLIGRVIQGIGGGGIITLGQLVFADIVPLRQRPRFFSLVLAAWAIGTISGPLIGGILVEQATWRWCFWINLPICGIALPMAFFFVRLHTDDKSMLEKVRMVDWFGGFVFTASLTAFLIAITGGGVDNPWGSWRTITPLTVGAVGVVLSIIYELHFAKHPFILRRLFPNLSAVVSYVCALCQGFLLFMNLYYIAFYFSAAKLASPLNTGIDLLPVVVLTIPSNIVSSALITRLGTYRWAIWLGYGITTIGCGLTIMFDENTRTAVWATGTKRFGLDGSEAAVPALETIIRRSAELGVEEIVMGMSHRGRLNVLANVMGKPYTAIFSEFQGQPAIDEVLGSGDVKYHLGTSTDRLFEDGKSVHLSLTPNPSHLEAVNPVVNGKVRAKQRVKGDTERATVMAILVHGDAAFAGQGIVHECFEMSELKGFRTGGTIHLIINNQIGFTTSPAYARTSPYPSDGARGIQAPIFHVNGDDPVAVCQVALLAAEFRQKFKKDVVIDLWCYRRHGHNEGDEPAFTQPLMYRNIATHPTTRQLFARRLEDEQVVEAGEAQTMLEGFQKQLDSAHEAGKTYKSNKADWLEGAWKGLRKAPEAYERGKTGVSVERLRDLGLKFTTLPESLNVHPRLNRVIGARRKAIDANAGIDWATAEHLAFATLLVEGFPVRLSGQDVGRGTFSQRHATIYDQTSEERYVPLDNLAEGQAPFEVVDSFLSEAGVLGFEYGYSLSDPNCLTLWEAQFGDFANGAQVYFDQFITSAESKWLRMSGLVVMLPHGMEGQGPEHSSARIERFLQLFAEDNIQVVNVTTPANHFHVLRRQLCRDFRKPLILMDPKSLLRHKRCVSTLDEMGPDTTFHRVMYDRPPADADGQVERVVLCSGKVFYDLEAQREELGLVDKIALVRLEQLAPFPEDALLLEMKRYPNAQRYVWCQEESRNMGAWFFVMPRIENLMESVGVPQQRLIYAGRKPSASPATGALSQHEREQKTLVSEALLG